MDSGGKNNLVSMILLTEGADCVQRHFHPINTDKCRLVPSVQMKETSVLDKL